MSESRVVQPAAMDHALADRIGLLLAQSVDAGTYTTFVSATALLLHAERLLREQALRGNLQRLGREVESHKYQLVRLNQAHPRTLRRLRLKTKDCDELKRWLVELGVDRQAIAKRLGEAS